jgi:hypothetical protein
MSAVEYSQGPDQQAEIVLGVVVYMMIVCELLFSRIRRRWQYRIYRVKRNLKNLQNQYNGNS